jgi:hypothetical protein
MLSENNLKEVRTRSVEGLCLCGRLFWGRSLTEDDIVASANYFIGVVVNRLKSVQYKMRSLLSAI